MLLHHSQPPSIKLEDRLVYPHTPTPSQFAPYSNSLGDTVSAWDCYSSNNNNSNITINNDNNNNNITTLDYYFNSNTNNTNNNFNIFNNNHTNDTNITNNFILNLDYPLHASTTNTNTNNTTTTTTNSNNNNTTQSGFQFNIPIFLSQIKEEIPEQHTTTSHHHRQHHQQQQHHQQHQRQQQAHYSTTPLSSQYPSPHTIANFAAMPTKKATTAKAAAAALAAMPKPPSLPHNASQSNPATSSPLSTASSQQQQQSTTVLPLSSLPSLSSSTTPPSPSSSSSSSVPMKFSVSSSISTSSSTSSSPPSSPPSSSSSPLSCTPLSFTETSYSTSDDKLYLVNNFTPESIVSTMSSSSDHHPNPHKKAKMIDMINNYNADQLKTTINDMSENNNFDLSYSNSFGLFVEGLDSDRLLQRIPLPDIWTTFGHPSPKDTTCCASDVSSCSSMIASDLLEPFETLQDVQLACPFGEDIDTTFFSSMETSCSEGDEEGSHIMSDCGYSSDHTTTQPSPISNESSNDWSGSFNNKLPVFEELQVSNREEEKRRPKRSTPSPGQKKKSKDSSNPNEKERKKPGRKPGQVSNVLHLWEFMRDLLHDPTISDGIIQWVSKSEGVFRVVDSSAVARLWGQKKNNKKEMTYEKLSRSLRYSRLEGYFDNLPKDKNYPKKLCFKFGPKSRHFSTLQGSTASPVNIDH